MALSVNVTYQYNSPVYNSANNGYDTYGTITFEVIDDNTGQPASGNGLQVYYTELDNNFSHGQYSVSISGTSAVVYPYQLLRSTGYQTSSITVTVDQYIQPGGALGPDGGPTITDVLILLPAHIAGGTGVVLIKATNDNMSNLQYFIDDVPVNPRFSGLTAGLHEAKVVDGISNRQAKFAFDMPLDEPFLLGTPEKEILPGINSRWNAAFNPVVFTYQRRDFKVTDVQNNNGRACIYTRDAITGLQKDDEVYLDADPYVGLFKVLSATDTTVTLNTDFIDAATGFMNSDTLRPYFKVVSRLTYTDPETGAAQQSEFRHSPNPRNGRVEADYSGVLRSLVNPQSVSKYDEINHNDPNLCASYTVSYRKDWEGLADDRWFGIGDAFYVTYSAMQVQAAGGGNMAPFIPNSEGSVARFVTDFKEPAYSAGYPFDSGFIYSELLGGHQYYLHITMLDVNRRTLGNPITHNLVRQVGLNRLLIGANNYPDNCWYLRINVRRDSGAGPVQVTEDKMIRIDRAIDVNSVYLRWIGYSGSWEYYRFVWNQEMSLNVQNAVTVKRYVYDYENTEGTEDTISKEAATGIKVFAEDLPVADIRALQSLKTSPKVQWLASRNPLRWQTVIVATGSAVEYETQMGTYAYQLQFTLPGVVVQTL
ncbi:hypothetical protein [Mucilaginibacter sp. CSA2-8R]|uniref:hypothetical protein n=1 Tax=Mucilaginibacter sp. CSA2-8R TaxID=3141542 RepID=UPI00315D750A